MDYVEYLGKVFKRDIGMLIPEKRMQQPAIRDHDPTMEGLAKIIAKAYDKDDTLQEGQKSSCWAIYNWKTSCWATTLVVGPHGIADKLFFGPWV